MINIVCFSTKVSRNFFGSSIAVNPTWFQEIILAWENFANSADVAEIRRSPGPAGGLKNDHPPHESWIFQRSSGGLLRGVRQFPEFQWWFSGDNRAYEGDIKPVKKGAANAFIRDLELMSRVDVLVGKFTSNFDRLALELRVGRDAVLPAFVSRSDWSNFDLGRISV